MKQRGGMAAAKLLCMALVFWGFLRQAAAQEGFISIDCGSTDSYTDSLGIAWVGDRRYTSSGANAAIDIKKANLGPDASTDRRKLQTLRYFPEPVGKFCYDLTVEASGKYLIRMTFLAGNQSSLNSTDFSVSLGAAHWQDLVIVDPWTPVVKEASFIALQVNLTICFRRGTNGDPFVNSIEVRPLSQYGYQLTIDDWIMTNIFRIDCGLKAGSPSVRSGFGCSPHSPSITE
ncbi:hypothetical protein R1flu_021747 [Riccia fluitans]|uniref:Malectin-like domain-containing protein n=1 Tax=Riccia fluitans TaxID=41844 RepID=A0ABD1ZTA1_9MARC